ncbi:MAG: protein kinase domain-containing protein [Myxococcota bacterium]
MPLNPEQLGWLGRHLWNRNTPDAEGRAAAQRAKLIQKYQERHAKLSQKLSSKAEPLQSIIKIGITQALEKIESSPQEALETFAELEKQLTRSYPAAEQEALTNIAQMRQTADAPFNRLVTQARRMKNLTQELEAALQQELDQFVSVDQDFLQDMRARPLTQDRLDEERQYFRQMNRHYQEVLEKIDALSARLDTFDTIQHMIRSALTQYHNAYEQFTPLIQAHAGTKLEPLLLLEQQNLRFALQRSAVSPLLHPDLKVLKPSRTLLSGMLMRQDQLAKRVRAALEQLKLSSQALDRDRDEAELADQWNAGRVVSFEERAHNPDNTDFDNVSDNQVLALREQRRADMNFIAAAFDATLEKARLKENGSRPPIELDVAPHFDPTTLLKKGWGTSEQISEGHLRRRIKQRMAQMLNGVDERTRRDLALDYILQGEADVRARLIEAQGWDANALSVPQENVLKSAIKVMDKTLGAYQAGTLSTDGNLLSLSQPDSIQPQAYTRARVLGKGGFGEVSLYLAQDGQFAPIAVKVMNAQAKEDEEGIPPSVAIEREIRCHHHLMRGPIDHPGRQFIVELKGVVKDAEGNLNMAMEALDGGDFRQNRLGMEMASLAGIVSEPVLEELHRQQLKQLIEGMMYLRDMGVVHHDLKPENFFMKADGTLKIGDFGGGSIMLSDEGTYSKADGTTKGYTVQSAELDQNSPDQDAFSLGRIMDVLQHQLAAPEVAVVSSHSSGALHPLLVALTEKFNVQRPTLEQVLASPFFENASAVDPNEIATLQRLSVAYGQQLAAALRNHRAELLPLVKPELDPEFYELLEKNETTLLSALKRNLEKLSVELTLTKELKTLTKELKKMLATVEQDAYMAELTLALDRQTFHPLKGKLTPLLEQLHQQSQVQQPDSQEGEEEAEKEAEKEAEVAQNPAQEDMLEECIKRLLHQQAQLRTRRQSLSKFPELEPINQQLKDVSARIQQAGVVA